MARRLSASDDGSSLADRRPASAVASLDGELLAEAAETFAMLSSPIRLHLLWLLAQGSKDVGTLAEAVGASVATVSQHLAKLRLSDLVTARRQGKHQMYAVDDPHVVTLVQQALDHHADLQSRARRLRAAGTSRTT
jgi:DNA-binding transcriptional ArsR family regulator